MDLLSLSRRAVLGGMLVFSSATAACARQTRALTVYKTATCPCCGGWVEHMRAAGFQVDVQDLPELSAIRRRYGVPDEASSCHTGLIGGYAIEGHVPAADVIRLLDEAPDAAGISVPGMPLGSPGMEAPNGAREAYQTMLIGRDGSLSVFAQH